MFPAIKPSTETCHTTYDSGVETTASSSKTKMTEEEHVKKSVSVAFVETWVMCSYCFWLLIGFFIRGESWFGANEAAWPDWNHILTGRKLIVEQQLRCVSLSQWNHNLTDKNGGEPRTTLALCFAESVSPPLPPLLRPSPPPPVPLHPQPPNPPLLWCCLLTYLSVCVPSYPIKRLQQITLPIVLKILTVSWTNLTLPILSRFKFVSKQS